MNYIKVDNCNMNNGSGLRLVIWFSYCPHHCKNCFNSETWDKNNGDKFNDKIISVIHKELQNDWCSGITLSGGDPTSQDEQGLSQLIELCEYTHSLNKNVWIWSGYTWEELFLDTELTPIQIKRQELIKNCDVLVDGRYIDEQRDLTLKWRGSKNQRVIDIQKSLKENKVILFED